MRNLEHDIGKTISKIRKEKGLTQSQLAGCIGVTDKAISKWESGGGFPDLSTLPSLARELGITIDYLMTGVDATPQVICISKIELCAKNDDVSLVEKFNLKITTKDENNKTLLDYIYQYESTNVFKYFLENLGKKMLAGSDREPIGLKYEMLKMFVLSKTISCLTIEEIVFACNNGCSISSVQSRNNVKNRIFTSGSNARIEELAEMTLGSEDHNTHQILQFINGFYGLQYAWEAGYAVFIDYAVRTNSPRLQQILDDINNMYINNQAIIKRYNELRLTNSKQCASIYVLKQTLQFCLDNNNFQLASQLNDINKVFYNIRRKGYILSDDDFKLAKMKLDKNTDPKDINAMPYLVSGIIDAKKLVQCNDHELYKHVISNYPYNNDEKFYDAIQSKNIKRIFECAVDLGLNNEIELILQSKDTTSLVNILLSSYLTTQPCLKKRHVPNISLKKRVDSIKEEKAKAIIQHKLKHDISILIDSIPQSLLMHLLQSGQEEMLVIKLCVKFEALLKKRYVGELNFENLLDKFIDNTYDQIDDYSNNYDPYTPKLLHKLRMRRNSIVHANQKTNKLTYEELTKCINVINELV